MQQQLEKDRKRSKNLTMNALGFGVGITSMIFSTQFISIEPNIGFAILLFVVGLGAMFISARLLGRS